MSTIGTYFMRYGTMLGPVAEELLRQLSTAFQVVHMENGPRQESQKSDAQFVSRM